MINLLSMQVDEEKIKVFFSSQPVLRAWLFGSQADGSATDESDIDILVELDHSVPVGIQFVGMWLELQQLLKKKVDLVSVGGVSPWMQPHIDRQKKLLYERR